LVLLNNGELSVNEIGTKSGLHRQVCYDALDRLVEKGFISYIMKNSKKFFKVLNPEKIIDYLDEKKHEIDLKKQNFGSILPELTNMFQVQRDETDVEVVKGKNVLRTIYNDIFKVLKENKEILLAMGIEETKFLEYDRIAIKQHINKLQKNKLKEKLLSKVSATHFFEGPQSEYRLIEDHLFNPNPTHIYGDKIAIVIWGHPTYGIIIKSKQIADANRKYFQMLWKIAKKRKKD
jgi:sugar-specific transcriptional regulator TrmB